ncbi:hypothetical protein CXP47_19895 [Pseudomonas chlororaphis]|uniref:Uncharacterized protein n=1 Tax=Pseudomonas chlororaphis TaxID=587753 RepID=A0AAQ0AMU3_9PSED|nr:hypothetical protein [Pseudomonas chlororaphis]AUG42043.1 hypothetical protein CXP47_19895 [Pseudomonas chlororaphis]PWY40920.1 hypothetical protein DK261_15415 [Pseudomonas sp. RW409]QNR45899.1 hypothetical protein HLB40_19745 [Pseudomonas chlororaphis]
MRVIRWLKFVLAAIGLFTVLKHGVILLIGMIDDPDDLYTQVYPSPSGRYSAALVSRSGGGAIAPFCSDEVLVFNSLLDVEEAINSNNYQVYLGECDSFLDHAPSPKVQWVSDSELRVGFALGGARMFSRNVNLRGTDASGNVQVRFAGYR